jgi:carboxymethylenebutenolidase
VINPFYRKGPAPVVAPGEDFQDPAVRQKLMGFMSSITPENTTTDAAAFVGFLDQQKSVDTKRKIGTTGYCMGGSMTIRTAAVAPDRVGAGASFHGARLVTKDESSPHLLIPKTKASYLFAIAESDDKNDPDAKTVLKDTCAKANRPAEIEVYAGAMHGWCAIDSRVYNHDQAERAWARLLVLFEKALA